MLGSSIEGSRASRRGAGRERRRAALIDAALALFSSEGVTATSVDDIVRSAGVAKGTFYLYFATKDDIVGAVAQRMVEGISDRIEELTADRTHSPVERVVAFGRAVRQLGAESYVRDLIDVFHRPENRAIHDRLAEGAAAQLRPTMATIIADGIEQGLFRPQDADRAATFVVACLSVLHDVVARPTDLPGAIDDLDTFVLRGLGYGGEMPR